MYKKTPLIAFKAGLLFAEAVITSAYVRFSLSYLNFKVIKHWQGEVCTGGNEVTVLTKQEKIILNKVQHAIRRCDKFTPWKTECYTQALTAKILLRRRNLKSILYIGFKKTVTEKTDGHAWLKLNGFIVTGQTGDLVTYNINGCFL